MRIKYSHSLRMCFAGVIGLVVASAAPFTLGTRLFDVLSGFMFGAAFVMWQIDKIEKKK